MFLMPVIQFGQRGNTDKTTTNSKFKTAPSTLVSLCEPLSLLGALISTDVLCLSVATSNMRSSYLQFIACPLSVCLTLKISPPKFQFGHREERQHVEMINEKREGRIFYPCSCPFALLWIKAEQNGGRELFSRCNLKEKWKRQTTMVVLLSQKKRQEISAAI